MKYHDYKHIAAWGRMMGSFPYYYREQQRLAALDDAPIDSVYFDVNEKKWVTVGDCHPDTQENVKAYLR